MAAPEQFLARVCLPLAGLALLAGCASSGTPTHTATPAGRSPSATGCPAPPSHNATWPAGVPKDLPLPPGAAVTEVKTLPASGHKHGVVVSLRVPDSLRGQIVFVHTKLPAAHFVLGRGDAEQDEADVPFRRADVTGQLRLRDAGECTTTWLLTVLPH